MTTNALNLTSLLHLMFPASALSQDGPHGSSPNDYHMQGPWHRDPRQHNPEPFIRRFTASTARSDQAWSAMWLVRARHIMQTPASIEDPRNLNVCETPQYQPNRFLVLTSLPI